MHDEPTDIPDPFHGVPEALTKTLVARGFAELLPIQRAVVDAPTSGRNLRMTSQTGSGKTVALGFAIYETVIGPPWRPEPQGGDAPADEADPAQESMPPSGLRSSSGVAPARIGPSALIIVPTRELADQVHAELRWLYSECAGVVVGVVTGGTDVRADQRRLRNPPTVLVGTPGRLLDHVRSGALNLGQAAEVVLDEADQMLDMGFRDELEAIVERLPPQRRSHLVSATFPPAVQQLARRFQSDPYFLEGTKLGVANADIAHVGHLVHLRDLYAALVNVLLANTGSKCLVFVQRRSDAAEVAESLAGDGFAALPISGDLPQAQRTRTLAAFKHGTVDILVATDVAARGIHVDDIGVVIHMDFPREVETYTHRSGRTGRAGQKGLSVSLVVPQAKRRVDAMLQRLRIEIVWEPLPSAKKIRKRITKETRRILHAKLESAELPEALEQYAAELVTKVDPARLVAVLLQLSERPLPTEPRQVSDAAEQRPRPTPHHGDRQWRGKPFNRERGPAAPRATGTAARPSLGHKHKKPFGKPTRIARPRTSES